MAKTENPEEKLSQEKKGVEIVMKLTISQLRTKHKELKELRENLHLKYHQITGQLEIIQEMIDGGFGEIEKS